MKMTRDQNNSIAPSSWVLLGLFAAFVALLGGSSRPDAAQIVLLRPMAALYLIPIFIFLGRQDLSAIRAPLMFIGALGLWMLLQLIPLPAGLWQALPGREPVAEIGAQIGLADIWRPISLVPTRTLNASASLIVPLAALLVLAAAGASRRAILMVLAALGSLNALLGILQVIGGSSQALFFYEITNFGSAVGFFANHNHSAVFSSLTLVIIAFLATQPEFRFDRAWQKTLLAALFLLVLLAALVGLSRAGLLTTVLALGASALLFRIGWAKGHRRRGQGGGQPSIKPVWALAVLAASIAGVIAIFLMFDRIPALNRVTESGTFDDLRWSLLPILGEMIAAYWLTGAGFGSFEEVYHIHEPASLMLPSYVNQAHNDWAQLLIEGGVPALAILAIFTVWVGRGILAMWRRNSSLARPVFWLTVAAIIVFASLADYPLRTPLFQMAAIWLVGLFAIDRRNPAISG